MKLFSQDYLELLRRTVTEQPEWGSSAHHHAELVRSLADECTDILDYGCGDGSLARSLDDLVIYNYDPVRAPDGRRSADMVVCIDVMEHVEPAYITNVIDDITSLARKKALFVISLRAAHYRLSDGSNAHCTVREPSVWLNLIQKRFSAVETIETADDELTLFCRK